jgi:hypothetical protein
MDWGWRFFCRHLWLPMGNERGSLGLDEFGFDINKFAWGNSIPPNLSNRNLYSIVHNLIFNILNLCC